MADEASGEMEEKRKHEHCCISHEFLDAAARNPNKIAVIHASGACGTREELIDDSSSSSAPQNGDQCFTFADILSSVDSLSSRLRSILDGADDPYLIKPQTQVAGSNYDEQAVPVRISQQSIPFAEHGEQPSELNIYKPKILGIYMPPCCEYIITVLSVLRCGEAFLPLDPSWPKERILSIVSSSSTDLVVACGPSFGASGSQPLDKSHWLIESGNCPILCFSMEESVKEHVCALSFAWPCKNEKQRAFCYLMYTSGSTGHPKGVCGTEQGLLNRFLWMQELYPLHGEELLLFKTSTSFIDHLQEFLGAVLTACTLVIPPLAQLKENIFSIVNFIQAYSISRLIAVPSLMRAILPALQEQEKVQILSSLKLLILSGEVLPLYLWDMLSYLLPETSILNLYGSTEVSGDCTYFDSKMLPKILETENLTSVPIGMPISNCDVVLVGEVDEPDEGEIYVGGLCISYGYLYGSTIRSLDHVKLHENSVCGHSANDCGSRIYFKTGDFGRRLRSGELIFLGRKDRTIKVNGHRIALEEIESTLRQHSTILDAAVISSQGQEELTLLEAFIVLKEKAESNEILRSSIRKWMIERLPLAVIPNQFVFMESLPMSSSGKVDFESLASLTYSKMHVQDAISEVETSDILQVIKKAFCNALMVEKISDDDDFFVIGGNSIAAAHASYNLGIDMRLLYNFPSPSELTVALLEKKGLHGGDFRIKSDWNVKLEAGKGDIFESVESAIPALGSPKRKGLLLRTTDQKNNNRSVLSKRLKMDSDQCVGLEYIGLTDGYKWNLPSIPMSCSFSRCNKVLYGKEYKVKDTCQMTWSVELPGNRSASMQELWKVHMESCVDASPLVVFKESDVYLFIGSHSHNFLCVNANSGSIQWEVRLDGRVECPAAIVGDFSQVVVGCYRGNIYFLDFSSGSICWTFRTHGEVKCQPIVDIRRQLIWCGSHDHNLYALDYRDHYCVYKLPCGGSIFGSPAIDEAREIVYVASTSGRVTAISVKGLPFHTLWLCELEVPVFGSLSLSPTNGYVICCLVDGHVLAFTSGGSIGWKCRTGGPLFAAPCMSFVLPSQVLICSRNGSLYSLELEKGDLLWEYSVGDPVTASAYIDENLQLISDPVLSADRLVCVCTSSGTVYLLRINLDSLGKGTKSRKDMVEEFARLELQGEIFSSPVMIGGRIFVGCRDDHVHCIAVRT